MFCSHELTATTMGDILCEHVSNFSFIALFNNKIKPEKSLNETVYVELFILLAY